MADNQGVHWRLDSGIGRIELTRPAQGNAIHLGSARALAEAIHAVLDAQPKAVLLTGQGRVFCAGGDIGAFAAAGDDFPALIDEIIGHLHPAIYRLATEPLPVVSAIGGAVAGAGIALALCADLVLAGRSAKLRTGYAAIGLSPDLGTSYFLARRVGTQRAKQWLMFSDAVDAQRCLDAGAFDALYPDEELAAAAEGWVQRLAAGSRASMGAIKSLCDGQPMRTLDTHLDLERQLMQQVSTGEDAREGVAAFMQKRAPRFTA